MPLLRFPQAQLVQRIRAEFEESPGLAVTLDEGAGFWMIDRETCARVLTELYEAGFLTKSADGHYRQRRSV